MHTKLFKEDSAPNSNVWGRGFHKSCNRQVSNTSWVSYNSTQCFTEQFEEEIPKIVFIRAPPWKLTQEFLQEGESILILKLFGNN